MTAGIEVHPREKSDQWFGEVEDYKEVDKGRQTECEGEATYISHRKEVKKCGGNQRDRIGNNNCALGSRPTSINSGAQ